MNKIISNMVMCNHCKTIIKSKDRHDFVTCKCGKVSVDGGKDYLKRSCTDPSDFTELSVVEKD